MSGGISGRWKAAALGLVTLFAVACNTVESKNAYRPSEGKLPFPPKDYENEVNRFSSGESEYSAFYNNLEYKATLRNSYIRDIQLRRMADYYQWDSNKLAEEKEKSFQQMQTETEVFVSFYTPERRNDNLADAKTIWRLYLDVGGRRYEGNVVRSKLLPTELIALYPYHSRWTTPYFVTFQVPTTAIETQPSKLTITGPLGTRTVDFSALQ